MLSDGQNTYTGKAGGVPYTQNTQNGNQVTFASTPKNPFTFGQSMKLAWMDMSHDFIYQGAALATEYALSELTDIDMKYSRVLGEGVGSLASKSFSNQGWKQMMIGGGYLRPVFFWAQRHRWRI